ncbi:peptidoglycan DD-metalloendopeptidase family protein [Candidatus Peregrinibacteria bacterium]|nr:peptidoglycan DD-metalloendopeptidase family protein [Candidatus Peregrinibacteria bacterium]
MSLLTPSKINNNVNHDARKERHHKLFGKTRSRVARFNQIRGRLNRHAHNGRTRFCDPLHGHSPAQRLFFRVAGLCMVLLIINSANPSYAYDLGGSYNSEVYDSLEVNTNLSFYSDQDGYITKTMPSEGEARYLNRGSEYVTHEVQPGDTLSVIAYRYDLSMNTILWANSSLGNGNYLKLGEEIKIPPADGYGVKVKSGNTLTALVEKYEGDEEQTLAFNELAEDGTLIVGEELFIVDGEKPYVYVAATTRNDYTTSYANTTRISNDIVATPTGNGWVRPTSGALTQGYRWGHYAFDIADRGKPPIVAADGGTVLQADYGWNGGYGNVVKIDHGNGYITLYAHMEELYVVAGDSVNAGTVIGKMGATGRVYGATGIHLHFELIYNGVKVNPSQVFGW